MKPVTSVSTRIGRILTRSLVVGFVAATAAASPLQDAAPATEPAKDLPAAEKILEQAMDAMGGRKAFDAVKSSFMKSTTAIMGQQVPAEMWFAAPDKLFVRQTMPMLGELTMGINGKIAWGKPPDPRPYELVEPQQLGDMSNQASLYAMVPTLEGRYGTIKTVDRVEFAGQDCYKVHLADRKVPAPNRPASEDYAFFSVDTALIVGMRQIIPAPTGGESMTVDFLYDEFKEFGDLKLFTRVTIGEGMRQMVTTIEEITFNEVDMAVFAIPEEVQKMYDEKKAAESAKEGEGEGESEDGTAKEEEKETEEPKEAGPATQPDPAADPELAGYPEAKKQQIKKQLESFLKSDDPAHLSMILNILQGQLGSVADEERPAMEYIVRKLKERIAELEGGGGAG